MTIGLDIHYELEIRKILQDNLSSRENMKQSNANLGNFGYTIFHADGIIKGESGIFGTRKQRCPYIIILNDLVVALVRDNSKTDSSLDMENGLPLRMVRNARRFYAVGLKKRAAQRLDREYNFLKDRSLFLFPFDVDNYLDDLIHFARKDKSILPYPMVKEIVPRKYWADEIGYVKEFNYDEILDEGMKLGYTLEDVLDRNGYTRSENK